MTAALAFVPAVPLRAVVYCRLSLDKDGKAESVADQEQEGRELCERRGFDVAEILTDNDISAYSGKRRPGYDRLVDLVRNGDVNVVIARRQDRLQRSSIAWGMFLRDCKQQHVLIATVQEGDVDLDTPEGTFMAQIAGNLAELESARIGKRVKARHRMNASKGKAHGGGRPFGYERIDDRPGELVVVPVEAELVREAAGRILRGASLNSIVIDWNDRGIPTVFGNKWRPNSLSKMLRSGRIAGLREVGGDVLGEGTWEPILPREQWERVRSRITHAPIGRRPRRNLLAGMVVCARCGAKMRAESGGNDRYRGRQYSCDKAVRHGCGSNSAKAEHVEAIVVAHVFAALDGVNLAQARARRTVQSSSTIVASIAADEQMMSDLAADLGARRISRAEWLAARDPIEARLADNRRALEQIAADSNLDDDVFEGLDADRWEELDLDQQRAVLRLFIERVEITKGGPGRTFDPSRVKIVPA